MRRKFLRWLADRYGYDLVNSAPGEAPTLDHVHVANMMGALSDGEFTLHLAEILFAEGGPSPAALEAYKQWLQEDPSRRHALVTRLTSEQINRQVEPPMGAHDPHACWIMGTTTILTPELWREKASLVGSNACGQSRPLITPLTERHFQHSGEYVVSAIASLWKGARYIESFLENITSQTLFDKSELIIIDADSPESEADIIRAYQAVYPNIVYHRVNYRIGIYEAWNEGVRMARGRYLTNTNLDDIRRKDSFELQAAALSANSMADVIYQDFFYSLEYIPDFERIAAFGFKSDLPIVTANNLLCYNAPHNAPMWRAQLHDDVGLFDTSYRSAGDYEFWMRCILHGKRFHKLNAPHVAYFQNPNGVSTSPDTPGIEEARRLRKKYARKLISPYLSMSRRDFSAALNTSPDWPWDKPAYSVVQGELLRLAAEF